MNSSNELQQQLAAAGQSQVWEGLERLSPEERGAFLDQLKCIDWTLVDRLIAEASGSTSHEEKSAQIQPLSAEQLVRQPASDADHAAWRKAADAGEKLLEAGKVAAVVVAGGQGTRLGFDLPKGMFPIGPVSEHSLFQIFCEQIIARSRQYGPTIPYCIMTSDATHEATVEFFFKHQRFGLLAHDVHFFRQGSLPAVDAATGRVLFSAPDQLALSPDGHGGMLRALVTGGLLDEFAERGIETLFYHQVDNPTTQVCDPAFLGWHALRGAEVSTKVVAKVNAAEKMGVAVSAGGKTKIIEYSDLSPEMAAQTDSQGRLQFWAGNTAIHVFQVDFLRRMASDAAAFPFHIARKAVPYLDESDQLVTPEKPNAFKFEQFIFDLLPAANRSLIVEADRAAEFNPVKNKDGADSPETCRAGLQALHRKWLRSAGATIGDAVPVEISPLYALSERDVKRRLHANEKFTSPTFLTTND